MIADGSAGESTGLGGLVNRIAGLLAYRGGSFTGGDAAAIRRMDPREPHAAFFKLEGLVLADQLPAEPTTRIEAETRWAAIVVGLAHLGDLHRSGFRIGRALVDAGFSELRFARLLRADSDHLIDQLPMVARFLTAKGVPADWSQAAWLLLSSSRGDEEKARRGVARDYYSALARSA